MIHNSLKLAFVVLLLAASASNSAAERVALVIGNDNYQHVSVLRAAANDARDLAAFLEGNGFHVIRRIDADLQTFKESLEEFVQRSREARATFFYFAGHGVESEEEGDNFLLPVDAKLSETTALSEQALSLGRLIEDIEALSGGADAADSDGPVRLILLDCCRTSPFPDSGTGVSPFRLGLRAIESQKIGGGTMVLFATRPGTVAMDSLPGESNSPFATALLAELDPARDSKSLYVSMAEVEMSVHAMTGGTQTPKQFFSGSAAPFHAFHLGGKVSKPSSGMAGNQAGELKALTGPGEVPFPFRWCPPGTFRMGSPSTEEGHRENEKQVEVTLSNGFWIGETEVTQEQWKSLTGQEIEDLAALANPDLPRAVAASALPGRLPQHPVYCLNWFQARAFAEALTGHLRKTGQLPEGWVATIPTEAQWEYACRAGSTLPFGAGISDSRSLSHRDAAFSWAHPYNAPPHSAAYLDDIEVVRRYPPNLWGLHDMHGNASEWVADAYSETLPGGRDPFVDGDREARRILRGGDFESHGDICRSAYRSDALPPDKPLMMSASVRLALVPASLAPAFASGGSGQPEPKFSSIWNHNGSEVGYIRAKSDGAFAEKVIDRAQSVGYLETCGCLARAALAVDGVADLPH